MKSVDSERISKSNERDAPEVSGRSRGGLVVEKLGGRLVGALVRVGDGFSKATLPLAEDITRQQLKSLQVPEPKDEASLNLLNLPPKS